MFRRNKDQSFRPRRRPFSEIWRDYRKERAMRRKLRKEAAIRSKMIRKEIWNEQKTTLLKFLKNPFGRKRLSREERIMKKHLRYDVMEHRKRLIRNSPTLFVNQLRGYLDRKKDEMLRIRKKFDYSIAPFIKRENSRELRSDILKTTLNSTVAFILTFWLVYLIGQLATILTAQYFSIPSVLHPYITEWPLYDFSPLYTRKNLILIFGTGPTVCLFISLIILWIYKRIYKKFPGWRLFLVWTIFHGITMFFAAYIAGVITRTGLVYSSAWLFLSRPYDIEEIIFMLSSVIILLVFGFVITRYFILATRSERIINPYIRFYYMLSSVLIPFLIGSLIIYLTNFPKNPLSLTLLQGFSLLMVLPTLLHYNSPSNQQLKTSIKTVGVPVDWKFIFFFLVVTVVIRIFLYPGIQFS